MSDEDATANESVQEIRSRGLAPSAENPRLNLDRVHRGLAQLVRQGVVRPNCGDYAPENVQADDDDGDDGEPVE